MKLIYGYTPELHKLAEHYIEREILCCDSILINALMHIEDTEEALAKAFTTCSIENYYNHSPRWINEQLTDEEKALLEKVGYSTMDDLEYDFPYSDYGLPEAEYQLLSKMYHEWCEASSTGVEIYEWYRVTSWLYEKLTDLGQPGLSNEYGHWWGRTCTGQSMIQDGIFQEIAKLHV